MAKELDNRFFPLVFDTISHGIFTVDAEGRITSFNRMAETLTGYGREEVLGRPCFEVFRADMCMSDCPLKRSIKTGERTEAREVTVLTKEDAQLPIAISTAALVNEVGEVIGGVEMFRDLSVLEELRKKIRASYVLEDIVAKSRAMQGVFEMLPLVAASTSTVLIEGDSGTGKELFARAIHNMGPRRARPFVAVNCAAMPDSLIESELFGYKRGAFTDAKKDKPGRFSLAEKGTLFIDEVGELTSPMQVKLLRVLQEKEYEPLGATHPVKADVRIIAATNRDLAREVKNRRFRKDLYYRLNVVRLKLPPLSERKEDIPILTDHFIKRFNAMTGRKIVRCSERVMAALMGYSFPGSVRELENAIEHAFVVCTGDTIRFEDLPSHIIDAVSFHAESSPAKIFPLQSAESETIRAVLRRHRGNRQMTAKELGISRNTLWRKMKKYDISG
jgi:PAS domain S-box-containing protein